MEIYVDADACPVVRITEKLAAQYRLPCTLLCDTNHVLDSDYSTVRVIGAGADAVDLALINLAKRGDLVVTQDYGVAAMALGKGCLAIHQDGHIYSEDNISGLLMQRHLSGRARRGSSRHHIKGPAKRTAEDDRRYAAALESLLQAAGADKIQHSCIQGGI